MKFNYKYPWILIVLDLCSEARRAEFACADKYFLNLAKLYQIWMVIPIFRLIQYQMEFVWWKINRKMIITIQFWVNSKSSTLCVRTHRDMQFNFTLNWLESDFYYNFLIDFQPITAFNEMDIFFLYSTGCVTSYDKISWISKRQTSRL